MDVSASAGDALLILANAISYLQQLPILLVIIVIIVRTMIIGYIFPLMDSQ